MIVAYVAVLPAAMTWFEWQEYQLKASMGCYKHSFWWFDTYDIFYRLTMTGFLLVISPNNSFVRMIASTLLAIFCLWFVFVTRPFLIESHNRVLQTGQVVVTITIYCGYVVESFENTDAGMLALFLH